MDRSDDLVLLLECVGAAAVDAVVISANQAFCRASGFAGNQLVGRRLMELFPIEAHADALLNAIRDGASLRTEVACAQASGGTFMLGLHLMPAPERTRGRICFAILGRDITAMLQARQMQNMIQRLLAKVFTSVAEAVLIVSSVGRILMTNPRVDHLLGYKPNELVGRASLDLVAPEFRGTTAEGIQKQMAEGGDRIYVLPLLRADGSQVVATITTVVVSTEDMKRYRIITLRPQSDDPGGTHVESAGRIRLIGMDAVRQAMGDRWHAVGERAMATAEAVIKRRCGKESSFSQVDDTSFLICFGTLSEQEASFRAAMIGREIRERLIGQGGDPASSYVRSVAAAVRLRDTGVSAKARHSILLDGLDAQLERLEREARQRLQSAVSLAVCDLKRISGRNANETIAVRIKLPDELERGVVTALAALPEAEAKAFDLDGLLLGLAARHTLTGMANGDATPLMVIVRFDVFASRRATERYLATCLRIDQRVSSRLILLLSSMPRGLPRTRQLDCVNRLRPFCRGLGYQVDNLEDLASLDLSFSATPIVSLPAEAIPVGETERLRALIGSLHAKRAKVLVRDVASEEDGASYRSFGADMISMR